MHSLIIGDVHGKLEQYVKLANTADRSIQLGDLGVGFPDWNHRRLVLDGLHGDHKFIRGNHDNPSVARGMANYIPDGHHDHDTGIFFVGGAFSIDKRFRIEGVDYWSDEECSYQEFETIYDEYVEIKPRIVMTHDAPESVVYDVFPFYRRQMDKRKSLTRSALQAMLDIHRPEKWFFGHWHRSVNATIDGTNFRCLKELESTILDV